MFVFEVPVRYPIDAVDTIDPIDALDTVDPIDALDTVDIIDSVDTIDPIDTVDTIDVPYRYCRSYIYDIKEARFCCDSINTV
ncbi:hypothetical protein AC249_AIPGENE21191 [Exaiptasia diaphana]|nr:hypothetical protein AC249_AIPGENE21191 [Exaiptasia diaphana]